LNYAVVAGKWQHMHLLIQRHMYKIFMVEPKGAGGHRTMAPLKYATGCAH